MSDEQLFTITDLARPNVRLVTKFAKFKVNIHPIDDKAIIPTRATPMSAGLDCHLHHVKKIINANGFVISLEEGTPYKSWTMHPNDTALVSLGFRVSFTKQVENDESYIPLARLYPRSGLALKQGIVLRNLVGIMDADYEGEYCAMLHNTSLEERVIKVGDRVCQMIIEEIPDVSINVVDGFEHTTDRGEGGFGSTGV